MYAIKRVSASELRWDFVLLAALAVIAVALLVSGTGADMITKAAGIKDSAPAGFEKIGTMANQLKKPALYAAGALVPLVLIGGVFALMLGSRQGMTYIGRAVGAMFLLAIVSGLAT